MGTPSHPIDNISAMMFGGVFGGALNLAQCLTGDNGVRFVVCLSAVRFQNQ